MVVLHDAANYSALVGLIGSFIYWNISERKKSLAQKQQGRHTAIVRFNIRTLMPAFGVVLSMQLLTIFDWNLPLSTRVAEVLFVMGHSVFWSGVLLAVWARETLGMSWAHAAEYQIIAGQPLMTKGPYRFIRHPIYTSLVMIVLGIEIALASWLIVIVIPLVVFFTWQAKKEETILIDHFGEEYRLYKNKTGFLLPVIKPKGFLFLKKWAQ